MGAAVAETNGGYAGDIRQRHRRRPVGTRVHVERVWRLTAEGEAVEGLDSSSSNLTVDSHADVQKVVAPILIAKHDSSRERFRRAWNVSERNMNETSHTS